MEGTPLRLVQQQAFNRSTLVESALRWVSKTDAPGICVIVGAPGTGKSILGRQILDATEDVVRSVYGTGVRETVALLMAIVRKLDSDAAAKALENLGLFGPAPSNDYPVITLHNTTVGGSVNATFKQNYEAIEPAELLHAVVEPILLQKKTNVVAFVDAIDEEATASTRRFIEPEHGARSVLEHRVRWLVTTRPGTLTGLTTPESPYEVVDLDAATQSLDVDTYLHDVLTKRGFNESAIIPWQEVCAGNFLVAHHLLEDLLEDPNLDPRVWIANPGLSGVYERFLKRLTNDDIKVLTLIAAAGRNGATFDAIQRRCASDDSDVIRDAIQRARPFLSIDNHRYATYHQSFSDHLLTPSDTDPTSQSLIRDAHRATIIDDLNPSRFTHLGPIEYGRLPWHISRIIDLTSPEDRSFLVPDPNALLWRMYHGCGVANRTMETEDVHAMYNPFHHAMLLFLAANLEDVDPEPTPESLASRHNIAHWLGRLNQQAAAISVLQRVVGLRAELLGDTDQATLNSLENLAYRVGQSGRPDEAAALFREALSKRNGITGYPNDPATLQTLHDLAYWTAKAGGIGEAVTILRDVSDRRAEFLGPFDRSTLQARHNLAYWMGKLNNDAQKTEALQILKVVLSDRCTHLPGGRVHRDSMASRALYAYRLGVRASTAEELTEAIAELESVLFDRETHLGSEHPEVVITRKNLASLMRRR
ncbi:Tetratricopeptide repeat [Actinobacteria bacterium IMCC26256]|nr:Tetratricopeptide repeat [Actinobacteria bacterium IMCC26256]